MSMNEAPTFFSAKRRIATLIAGSSVVRPKARASGSKVAPWISVEVSTTKKTMLKNEVRAREPLEHREGREHDRDRAAQARPS